MISPVCKTCGQKCEEIPCAALRMLHRTYQELKTEDKRDIIKRLRKDLALVDCEVADDLEELGNRVITVMPELYVIREYDVKIGYVRSYERKTGKGKEILADCRKVTGTYTAYLPFDFVVTFYETNTYHMSDNQKKILMLHELRHIGIGDRGLKIEPHDVEDFKDILLRFGMDWNGFNQDVPDILAGGDVAETKGNKMEAKPKASGNGRTLTKPRRSKNKN